MARNKRQRIKHYKRSFYSIEQRFKKGVALAVLIIVVLILAWLAAPHVLDWATHTWYTVVRDRDLSASSQTAEETPQETTEPTAAPTETATPEPTPTPTPSGTEIRQGTWASVDVSALEDADAIEMVAQSLAQEGVTYALIELKDTSGNIYYRSSLEAAANSIADTVIDLETVATTFREAGITPVAWMAAFRDPIAPYTVRSMGIRYKSEYMWLDAASVSAGGKPWLNPYSEEAVQFIGDLIEEVHSFGFEQVVLGNVQFPSAVSSKQDFGTTGGATRSEQLTKDIAAWQERFADEVTLWYEYPLSTCQEADNTTGTLPSELGVANLMIRLSSGATDESTLDAVAQQMKEQGVEYVVVHDSTGVSFR
jgi:hypothetical protein